MSEFDTAAPSAFQLEDALEILERRKWWIAIATAVGLVIGTALTFALPAQYEATTTILVVPQQVPEDFVRSAVALSVAQQIESLHHRVTTLPNLTRLIKEVGEERLNLGGTRTREDLMEDIRDTLTVEIEPGREYAPLFEIAYTSRDPEVAADVARAFAKLFIDENIQDRSQQAQATTQFLDRELDRIRQEVTEQEEKLGLFRQERMGSLPSELDTNLRTLDRLNFELANNLESQESASQRIALLRRQADAGTDSPSTLVQALTEARQRLFEMERTYTDEHPNVLHLKAQIERLEAQIAEPPATASGNSTAAVTDPRLIALQPEIANAQLELDARKRREERIRAEIESLQGKVADAPVLEQEMKTMTRDYTELIDTYHSLLAKKYEAAISRNLEEAQQGQQFKLHRPARIPEKPSWPDPLILVPAGVGGCLAFVAILIAIGEFRSPAFRSVGRLTRMVGLPVFASIPQINKDEIYDVTPDGGVDPKLVVFTAPESAVAEQYRGFLPAFIGAENCKVILVTSAQRGDGKSLTCMNLAISLAIDLDKRVLVIDSDMRRPTQHRLVRISRKPGLSDILQGIAKLEDCAVNSKIPNVTVVPAGPLARNPLTLIAGDSFLKLIDYARASYDIVVIDSPPLLPVVDTRILRNMADMIVFVVRADATPPEAALRSLKSLRDVAGVVFNSVSAGSFRRYYYYDAYSRYAYGEASAETDEEPHGG